MKKIALIALSVAFIIGCSKESDEPTTENNNPTQQTDQSFPSTADEANEMLNNSATKNWEARSFNLSSVGVQDCRLDDEIVFNNDGTYTYNNGDLRCGGDVANQEGVYELDFENRVIIFDKGTDDETTASLTSLNGEKMMIKGSWSVFEISAEFVAQ